MLAPVAYPWPGGVGRYNELVATPVIGPLLAYTITLPLGYFLAEPVPAACSCRRHAGRISSTEHRDAAVAAPARIPRQCARPGDAEGGGRASRRRATPRSRRRSPIITGDVDKTVSTNIHSRPLAATAPNAKLIVLPGVGHMVQQAAPDLVIAEIEAMIGDGVEHGRCREMTSGVSAPSRRERDEGRRMA